ncbi:aromatic ring-hydroxylating dioxygenase subunit alpha, partial [Escherichia coli]|nr:aromatic ring-hydroxylating dioxygenase subunit alpha [Escherichia coli]
IDEPRGNARAGFFCRFHGWKYGLDGSLQHVADEEDWNCDAWKADSGLKGPTVDIWGGWVWINMDANAEPLLPYLGVVATTVVP